MALLHAAQITPTKIEVLRAWMPTRRWFTGDVDGLESLGAYRFDDPEGEVGIETFLVRSGDGPTFQVPVTYRGAPLAGADEWLMGTMEHTFLGRRWVYDGCGDPVYAAALATAILTGGGEAAQERRLPDGTREPVELTTRVEGSGTAGDIGPVGLVDVRDEGSTTVVVTSAGEIVLRRAIDPSSSVLGEPELWALELVGLELIGTWPGVDDPTVLAVVR